MRPRIVRSAAELRAALQARQDEIDVSNATIEQLVGLGPGYLSKVTAARPTKGLTARTLRDILDGLALGVVAVVLIEDPKQAAKMRPRWTKRRRPPTTPRPAAAPPEQTSLDLGDGFGGVAVSDRLVNI